MGAKKKNTSGKTEKQQKEAKTSLSGSKSGRRHPSPGGEIDAKRIKDSIGGETVFQSNQAVDQAITRSNGKESGESKPVADSNSSTADESNSNEVLRDGSFTSERLTKSQECAREEERVRHRRHTCGDGPKYDTELPFDKEKQSEFHEAQMADFRVQPWQLKSRLPVKPAAIENTSPIKIQTVAELFDLIADLSRKEEIAVDLEFYRERKDSGKLTKSQKAAAMKLRPEDFMCLLQMSTRTIDYIVVPFLIWKNVADLKKIFADPKIVKVLHDLRTDIEFLRKDFGICVINVFDTSRAMVSLELEETPSLKNLVWKYCNVKLDKTNQTSDFSKRFLSTAQVDYSRRDTHYLLHCYDKLREELLERENGSELLRRVYEYGHEKCKKTIQNTAHSPGNPPVLNGDKWERTDLTDKGVKMDE